MQTFLSFQVISSEGNTWKMVLIDENKAKGHAPPFFQKILCSNAFHTFILCLVLASGITGANLAFDHKTKFNDGQPDGFYFAEVYFSFSSSNYFVICTVVLLWGYHFCNQKICLFRRVTFLKRDNLVVFYYLKASESGLVMGVAL